MSSGGGNRTLSLCLSGGGFRAALFHLGVLRRLNEIGALSTLDRIASVSGGSVISAYLANMLERDWPAPGASLPDWENSVARPFRNFTNRDLSSGPILSRFWPWNWFRKYVTVRALARRYANRLTTQRLGQLPDKPDFVFLATDMAFGTDWVFERRRMGNYRLGYCDSRGVAVADAVAASSAFPPSFDPMPLKIRPEDIVEPGDADRRVVEKLLPVYELTDGGIYDNLGLEPVWKQPGDLLVSDGGASFKAEENRTFFKRLFRYFSVLNRGTGALRKRWLMEKLRGPDSGLRGAYFAVSQTCLDLDPEWRGPSYGAEIVRERIQNIRTNMDRFTHAESCVLENHGYLVAGAAIGKYAPFAVRKNAPVSVPHPDWMDEDRVWRALRTSWKSK